ncbi:hypothetical protein M408DRAFT_197635 [Serendipita vermifera MAFF 305830]|uniref:Uncharacterized protein n=1 Tax=Serendipita vermifera MAFF 305830 TaxID=933852 RepID=A0A0C2WPS2_SERVB|nr:hypothetical protein M408DRAFT_197635 [Serendipita vermifera MAFF 305830]
MKVLRRKVVVVGDSGVGKTCMLAFIAQKVFNYENLPFNGNYTEEIVINGKMVHLRFWDTLGGEMYDRSRPLRYFRSGIILICFAIDNRESFLNITRRWCPEIMAFCSVPKVPILLIGCKADLRDNANGNETSSPKKLVTSEEGNAAAAAIGAIKYMECSAVTGKDTRDVLMQVAQIAGSWNPQLARLHLGTCRPF